MTRPLQQLTNIAEQESIVAHAQQLCHNTPARPRASNSRKGATVELMSVDCLVEEQLVSSENESEEFRVWVEGQVPCRGASPRRRTCGSPQTCRTGPPSPPPVNMRVVHLGRSTYHAISGRGGICCPLTPGTTPSITDQPLSANSVSLTML